MTVTDSQLMQSLEQGKFAPIYVLCGEEPYYIDKACVWFENNLLDEAAREFDQTVLYGKDLEPTNSPNIEPVVNAARGFAMFGGKRVVILKEGQTVKKWDALGLYLDNPNPNTILVICYKGKPDQRLSVWKKAAKVGVWFTSDRISDHHVAKWINDYITQRNKELKQNGDEVQISPQITQLLADSLGTDLTAIVGALQKLIDGRPAGVNTIDSALVERNIGISRDYNIFELEDALIKGNTQKANRIAQHFATSKDHAIQKELPVLFGFFVNLLMYHYYPEKGNEQAIAKALALNSTYFVRNYAAAARRYSAGKTFRIIGYIRAIDARSKGIDNLSAGEEDLWKELIYEIMH